MKVWFSKHTNIKYFYDLELEVEHLTTLDYIISTEKNSVVSSRAGKLSIPCLQGIENKKDVLMNFCKKNDIDLINVAYVGNDINDKEAMEISGVTFCPSDAHESILDISDHILKKKGGQGVIRELFDIIIGEIKIWVTFLKG